MAPPSDQARKRRRTSPERLMELPDTEASPVLRLDELCRAQSGNGVSDGPAAVGPTGVTLAALLAPLDPDVFLRRCFRRCAVHAPAGPAAPGRDRFQHLERRLRGLDPGYLLRATASDSVFVWLSGRSDGQRDTGHDSSDPQEPPPGGNAAAAAAAAAPARGRIHSIEVTDPEAALALLRAGHATYCRAPPAVERHLVAALLRDTGLGGGQYDASGQSGTALGRGEAEVFLSAAPGQRTDWHYDFQENFTLQLSGVKRWALQRGTVRHPQRGCTPHYAVAPDAVEAQLKSARCSGRRRVPFGPPVGPGDGADDSGDASASATGPIEHVTLRPGDVLYFPAGMWHRVDVLEPGTSLNVSLMATTYAEVACQALQHLLLRDDAWRAAVANDAAGASDAVWTLDRLLARLPGVVQEFREKYGADAILPPVLRTGQTIGLGDSDKDGEDEDVEDDEEIFDMDDETDSDSDSDDELVKPDASFIRAYELPEISMRQTLATMNLIVNPLACLIREDEIRDFCEGPGNPRSQSTFIVNINFAGNASHESAIRRRIREKGRLLQHLYQHAKDGEVVDLPDDGALLAVAAERAMLGYLVHLGYLLWRSKP